MSCTVRLKIKCDASHFFIDLPSNSTLQELEDKIVSAAKIENEGITLLSGFPPKAIDLPMDLTLLDANIVNGESIILKTYPISDAKRPKLSSEKTSNKARPAFKNDVKATPNVTKPKTVLVKKIIPSDNSCLFASVYFCLNNGSLAGFDSDFERQLVCGMLLSEPEKFNSAFLEGKSPEEYCQWIMNKDRWGGSIELYILSNTHSVEIDVVNINTNRIDRFGEDCNHSQKILIIYDGIHYDALAIENVDTGALTTKYLVFDDEVIEKAKNLAAEMKSRRQFTDVNQFRIICRVCDLVMVGQSEIVKHANATGHSDFGEI